jgi:hypothetical protein
MSYDNLAIERFPTNVPFSGNKSIDPNLIYLQMQQIPMTDMKQKGRNFLGIFVIFFLSVENWGRRIGSCVDCAG